MKIWAFLAVFSLSLFLTVKYVLGYDPPKLFSPQNNSVTSSSKLTWETPTFPIYSNNPYNIQVDNNQDFSSVEKNYQTKNTSYSPQLEPGLWYWRVRVKDAEENWSNFTTPWAFTLNQETPKPTTSSTQQPQENDSTKTSKSSFIISSPPNEIDSTESFEIEVNLELPSNPNSTFYLKGAFKEPDSSNYFGQTLVSGSWIKNNRSYSDQFKIETNGEGKFSGKLTLKPDPYDSGFKETGEYSLKVARYSSTGSGPTWSEEKKLTIKKIALEESLEDLPSPTNSPLPTSNTKLISKQVIASNSATPTSQSSNFSSDVAGVATTSTELEVKNQKTINWLAIGGGFVFLLIGVGFIVKLIRDKKKQEIYNKLR